MVTACAAFACRVAALVAQQLAALMQQRGQVACSTQQCWHPCCLGQGEQQAAPVVLVVLAWRG
jgi:hypothetical protein